MRFIGGGGDEITDVRAGLRGCWFVVVEQSSPSRIADTGRAVQISDERAVQAGFLFVGVVFFKGYLTFESGLERRVRMRDACLSTFVCHTLTAPASNSFRRISGAM